MKVSLNQYGRLLSTYLKPQWRRAVLLGGLLLVGIGLELLNPQILGRFIDGAVAASPVRDLVVLAVLFLGLALVTQLISVAQTYVAADVGLTATNQLRADLTLHCLHLDRSFHNSHTPGELIERVDGDVAKLGNFFSQFVVQLLGSILLLLGVLFALFRIDWRVGLALTVFSVLTLLVINSLRDVAVPAWTAAREASAWLFGLLEERLSGTEDIRANGATAYVMRRFYEQARNLWRREIRAILLGTGTYSLSLVLFTTGTAVSLALGIYLYQRDLITIGTIYLIFRYTELLTRPIEQISRQFQDLQQAGASLNRVNELLNTQSALVDGVGGLPAGRLGVEFDNVTFGYVAEEPILQNISFQLRPGKILGLLGRTGSGKTTLTRLLFRFYDPVQGEICLGETELRQVRLQNLRQRVGMVTQDIQLFHATVRHNLTFFDPAVPDERILEALRELGLWGWYESLPDGLDTRLAPGGGDLSAGQAQLLAFVRVFLRDPDVIILDEASSRLDPATERLVEQALERLLAGRTVIIIAHRLGTVQRADEIMILEAGRIGEHGLRAELAADPGSRFAQLLQTGLEEALV